MPPHISGVPAASASATRSSRNSASPRPLAAEPTWPISLLARHHRQAGAGREVVIDHRHHAAARAGAMLDARDHLLPDIAAFVEIDAGELVHVGLVRKGVAVDEIDAAARHAERDAVRLVGFRVGEPRRRDLAAASAARCGGSMHAHAERGQARVGIAQAVFAIAGAVPQRHHAEHFRQVLADHLGAQLVEIELAPPAPAPSAFGTSRKKPPPSSAGASATMKSTMILPCGVSSAAKRAAPGATLADVGGDQAVEEARGRRRRRP